MAEALGLPRPSAKAQVAEFDRLYLEMWPALQALVEHVPLRPAATTSAASTR